MVVLKSMLGSIHPLSPMRVIKYATFKEHGRIPRSNDRKTVLLSEVPSDAKVRWLLFLCFIVVFVPIFPFAGGCLVAKCEEKC